KKNKKIKKIKKIKKRGPRRKQNELPASLWRRAPSVLEFLGPSVLGLLGLNGLDGLHGLIKGAGAVRRANREHGRAPPRVEGERRHARRLVDGSTYARRRRVRARGRARGVRAPARALRFFFFFARRTR
ncbi:MAG: hypothetical protein EBZ77_13440, partial [Chitinophagia bacterium]|nr:hypothetical protein [Chitinophagia bacterium]